MNPSRSNNSSSSFKLSSNSNSTSILRDATLRPENVKNIHKFNWPSESGETWRRITDYEVRTTIGTDHGGDLVSSVRDIKKGIFLLTGTLIASPACMKTVDIRIETEVGRFSIDFGRKMGDPSRGFWLRATFIEENEEEGEELDGPEIWYRLEKPSAAFAAQGAEADMLTRELLRITDAIKHRGLFPLSEGASHYYLKNVNIFDLWERADRSFSLEFVVREGHFIIDQLESFVNVDRSKMFTSSIRELTAEKIASYLKRVGDEPRKRSRLDGSNSSVDGSVESGSLSEMHASSRGFNSVGSSSLNRTAAATRDPSIAPREPAAGRTVKLIPLSTVAAKSSAVARPTDINTLRVDPSRLLKNASGPTTGPTYIGNSVTPTVAPGSLRAPSSSAALTRPGITSASASASSSFSRFTPPISSITSVARPSSGPSRPDSTGGSTGSRSNLHPDTQRKLAGVLSKINGASKPPVLASSIETPPHSIDQRRHELKRPASSVSRFDAPGKSNSSDARRQRMEAEYDQRFRAMANLATEFLAQSVQERDQDSAQGRDAAELEAARLTVANTMVRLFFLISFSFVNK